MASEKPSSAKEAVSTLFLNPMSAFTVTVAGMLMRRSQMSLLGLLNPWELSLTLWVVGYALVRVALLGFVDGMVWILGPMLPPLPSRTGPKAVFQHKINSLDITYLVINSTIEFIFAQQIGHLLWHAAFITRVPTAVGLLRPAGTVAVLGSKHK